MSSDIESIRANFQQCVQKIGDHSTRVRFETMFSTLVNRHQATAVADQLTREKIEEKLLQLSDVAQIVAESGGTAWRIFSMAVIAVVVIVFFLFVMLYFYGLGPDRYGSIEATRPILVFTLIVSMLGFGGLLIIRPLFSTEQGQALQDKFRLAREIFLVFSGIFGTIIGFYFGAGDDATLTALKLNTPRIVQDGGVWSLLVDVDGGKPGFKGNLTLLDADKPLPLIADGDLLSVTLDRAAVCPANAVVTVEDAGGRSATAKVADTAAVLAADFPKCGTLANAKPAPQQPAAAPATTLPASQTPAGNATGPTTSR